MYTFPLSSSVSRLIGPRVQRRRAFAFRFFVRLAFVAATFRVAFLRGTLFRFAVATGLAAFVAGLGAGGTLGAAGAWGGGGIGSDAGGTGGGIDDWGSPNLRSIGLLHGRTVD